MYNSALTFYKGGVHPPERKELCEQNPIEAMPLPQEVTIPLTQHFGSPCKPLVKKNDEIKEGDVLGATDSAMAALVHSSVSGKVKGVEECLNLMGTKVLGVNIQVDKDSPPISYQVKEWRDKSPQELLERVKAAGIVGMGGAGFPTHIKLSPPKEAKVDTLILNGAECEPYLTTDQALMREKAEEILEGAKIILKILGIRTCFLGVEENKPDAISALKDAVAKGKEEYDIQVKVLKTKYPQGSEKQLIYAITQRKVPGFGLPFDVGVVVQNVATTYAIYEAVVLGKPLYERVVTITGKGINRTANLLIRVGTKIKDVVEYLGGTREDLRRVIVGGPMMGFAVPTLDIPITKTTSGILFLTKEEVDESPHKGCIRCGWCLDACPMGIMPNEIGIYVEADRAQETGQFGVFECFECGSCAYVCPAKRPLVQFIRYAKTKAKR